MQPLRKALRIGALKTIALASVASFSLGALAHETKVADYLSPVPSYISSDGNYEDLLRDAFKQDENLSTLSAMYIIPSMGVESMVGLRQADNGAEVFSLTAETPIRNLDRGRYPPKDEKSSETAAKHVKMLNCSKPIVKEVADRVTRIWQAELLKTQHEDADRIVIDGTNFIFSAIITGKGQVSGQYLSPPPRSRVTSLVNIGVSLKKFCEGVGALQDIEKSIMLYEKH